MLYAIGEIILVMIGILLALQVNNWNEKRKANEFQVKILKELKLSLESDLNDVENKIVIQDKIIDDQLIFLDWIESSEDFTDSLSPKIFRAYDWTNFDAYDGPFETLKQLGMHKIENDSLRTQISKLYDIIYTDYYLISVKYENLVSELYEISGDHFTELFSFSTRINDPEKLRKDKIYISKLKTLRNFGRFLIDHRMVPTKNEIEKTLRLLDDELAKR